MNRIKRQRTVSQSGIFLEAFKKKNCLENLSNEIFYEIFDYLDGYDIYKAFSNLNIHFENLLISTSFFMKIEISSITTLDSHYQQFIKSNKHHIISLNFDCELILNEFLNLFTIDLSFARLESLFVNKITTFKLPLLLFYLKSLSHLSSLSIRVIDCHQDIGDFYQMAFHLSLKYFQIGVPAYPRLDITIPIAAQDQFSSIKYLLIYHKCTLNQLINIVSHTPQLCNLQCFQIIESIYTIKSKLLIKLNHLVRLTVTLQDLEFDEFEEFLLKLCSRLQLLNVDIQCVDENYLDANRWERLIIEHLPCLTKFLFRYSDDIDNELSIRPYHRLMNHFTSLFWINRKWILKVLIEENELIYAIRPYTETWIDVQEYLSINQYPKTNIDHSSNSYFLLIELSINDIGLTKSNQSLINKINPILNILQITYLDIDCYQMSTSIVISFLNTLQNLKSISIWESPFRQRMKLSDLDLIRLNAFLKTNQITKLTLRNITETEHIDFIFHRFPRLQFFGFEQVRSNNLKSLVRYILQNIKANKISHPMTICIFPGDATYDRVIKLHRMIDSKNLLSNYTIHRQYNRFYIQWK